MEENPGRESAKNERIACDPGQAQPPQAAQGQPFPPSSHQRELVINLDHVQQIGRAFALIRQGIRNLLQSSLLVLTGMRASESRINLLIFIFAVAVVRELRRRA